MKTAAAYIRVSTDDQTEYSPSSQLEKIREYAKRNDYILPDEYIFIDEGISGRTTKRPAFNQMIGTAKTKPKPFDAILLWKFSRFARNREDSIVYKSMLRKQCGIDVISISENIGDDKMSVIMEAMIEAMDEYYSINLGEEVRRGMNEKVQRGEAVTIPSFGYDIENGQYIPNPETAPVVKEIFADFLDGKGLVTIARELNENGYRTRRGNKFENRTVRYMLKNPVYIGKIRWTPTGKANHRKDCKDTLIIDGTHEPIISREIFDKVQTKLSKGSVKYMRENPAKEPFMLQGLVRCSDCGATLCMSANYTSLQCYAYAHGKCNVSHSISLKKINALVIQTMDRCIETSSFHLEITSKTKTDENIPLLMARENKKLERIKDAYENGVYTLDEYKKSRDSVQSKINELEEKFRTQQSEQTDEQAEIEKFRDKLIPVMPSLKTP
ncbi:MAG: recombinase family protein, partial [Clostridia bacterium]|nr:recombinase family protein [Clostridia bacterium]